MPWFRYMKNRYMSDRTDNSNIEDAWKGGTSLIASEDE